MGNQQSLHDDVNISSFYLRLEDTGDNLLRMKLPVLSRQTFQPLEIVVDVQAIYQPWSYWRKNRFIILRALYWAIKSRTGWSLVQMNALFIEHQAKTAQLITKKINWDKNATLILDVAVQTTFDVKNMNDLLHALNNSQTESVGEQRYQLEDLRKGWTNTGDLVPITMTENTATKDTIWVKFPIISPSVERTVLFPKDLLKMQEKIEEMDRKSGKEKIVSPAKIGKAIRFLLKGPQQSSSAASQSLKPILQKWAKKMPAVVQSVLGDKATTVMSYLANKFGPKSLK